MRLFTIRCHQCGDQNPIDDNEMSSIKVYFQRGTPTTHDRMELYCENCGNKEDRGISWPIDRTQI